jgi:GntR family transcriptional regulator of arabinose operon
VNTELCHYTYSAITKLSKHIPEDIELVTFDPPGILDVSYVRQNENEMCRLTADLLIEQIEGRFEPQRIVVPVTLINTK